MTRTNDLLPDAESAEDPVEDVVGDHGTDDLAELLDGQPEVEGDQLVAAPGQERFRGGTQGRLRRGRCFPGIGRPSRLAGSPSAATELSLRAIAVRSASEARPGRRAGGDSTG